ncbi:hypothetical protein AZE42_13819, partial [Rhizopogon vesiculosus]
MLSEWILAFKSILDDHQKDFLEADGKKTCSRVARKVRKAILEAHHDQEQDGVKDLTLPDPSSLKKEIKQYYVQIATEQSEQDLAIKDREANARPKDASFYKKELNDWVVAQKLFKTEMDAYDKAEQVKKGVSNEIRYRTGHAREWFNNMSA